MGSPLHKTFALTVQRKAKTMKLMPILGTRPEIIRLSVIIKHLDKFCEQILVHTGQNYDENLSDTGGR